MKIIFCFVLLFGLFAGEVSEADPTDGLGNRMEHCSVASVTGAWAMAHYPAEVDLYYGSFLDPRNPEAGWNGYVALGFPSGDPNFPLNEMTLYPVMIVSTQTASYAGDTATGTTQPISFKFLSFDDMTRTGNYELVFKQDSGIYSCTRAWPVSFRH